jgi:hypothetical protein
MDPIDAELALAEVRARRSQVIDANTIPDWFWSALGVLIVLFVAAVESRRPWWIGIGSSVYAIGLTTTLLLVIRQNRVQLRPALIGASGLAAIMGFTLALVAIGVGLGLRLDAAGFRWPATISVIPVAIGLAAGGPLLMRHLRRLMRSRPLAGDR